MRILFGEEFVDQNCVLINLINANSPMVFDGTMLGALKVYARANQASIVSPFIVGGAMSPVTVAGTLAQVFGGSSGRHCLFHNFVVPDLLFVMGTFATAISMQTGAPSFGTPEPGQVLMGAGQFARKFNLPFRSGGSLTGAKIPDSQAAFDSANTLWPAMMGGVKLYASRSGLARRRLGFFV